MAVGTWTMVLTERAARLAVWLLVQFCLAWAPAQQGRVHIRIRCENWVLLR